MTAEAPVIEVDVLFRSVHTIKGMAAAMGYGAVERIAHALEDALGHVREAPRDGRAPVVRSVSAGLDCLDDAVEACIALDATPGKPLPSDAAHVQRVLADLAGASEITGSADAATGAPASLDDPPSVQRDEDAAAVEPVRVPQPARTLRVDVAALDRLLDLAGELTNVRARVADAAARAGDVPLARAVADLGRVSGALADEVRTARLVGLAELLGELPRIVRQAARATGKRVLLETTGGDVVADRAVIDALAEPLTHLLRNAVDHGIEAPEARARAGKPPDGRIAVRVARDGNALVVHVHDDGRGVDRAGVVARARARGQLPPATDADAPVDDATLLECLALPGLTTAREVSRVSGRGVGVDAALARVRALGGALVLETTEGRGTCFTLRMPLSWAVVPALVVRAGLGAYAIPLAHVRGTRDAGPDDLAAVGDGWPATRVPCRLTTLLGTRHDTPRSDVGAEIVLLASGPSAPTLAVRVDELVGVRDCVLKPIDAPRRAFRIAAGATILDGGEVALVLDVPAVATRATAIATDHAPATVPLAPAAPITNSYRADDPRTLNAIQRDALREVANIGAGHAATALSQLTGSPIMISVPTVHVAPLSEIGPQLASGADTVAAVLMDVMGDLTGRTLLVLPKPTVLRLAERMLRRPVGASVALGEMERSALKEAGNILSGAYLNALSDFMGLVVMPSPPTLAIDAVAAVLTPSFLRLDTSARYVFVVETEFVVQDVADRLHGFFLLLPDPPSLGLILRAARVG